MKTPTKISEMAVWMEAVAPLFIKWGANELWRSSLPFVALSDYQRFELYHIQQFASVYVVCSHSGFPQHNWLFVAHLHAEDFNFGPWQGKPERERESASIAWHQELLLQ